MDGEPRDAPARVMDAVPVPGLFQQLDMPDAKSPSACLLRSDYGVIMSTQKPVVQLDCATDVGPFRSQMHTLESISAADIRYHRVLFFGFSGADNTETFYNMLIANECDIVGVSCVETNLYAAVCRRTLVRKKFKLGDLKVDQIYTLKHMRGDSHKFNCAVVSLIEAWQMAGKSSKVNFELIRGAGRGLEGGVDGAGKGGDGGHRPLGGGEGEVQAPTHRAGELHLHHGAQGPCSSDVV